MLTKVHIVKAMVFPVVMYGCESWTVKKTEHWRLDVFKPWSWSRLLRIPWKARRSNQSILKEINPEYSLEGLMLKLKVQYFGHLMWRADSLEKTLVVGKINIRRRGWQRMRWLDGITNSKDMNLGNLQKMVRDREAWHAVVHRVTKNQNDLVAEWQPGHNQISCKPLTAAYFSLFMWKLVSQVTYLLSVEDRLKRNEVDYHQPIVPNHKIYFLNHDSEW